MKAWIRLVGVGVTLITLSACQAPGIGSSSTQGIEEQPLSPIKPIVPRTRCESDDPNFLCLAAKWVVFEDELGTPVTSRNDALSVLEQVNGLWKKCRIGFHLERYEVVKPVEFQLQYEISEYSDLRSIRKNFSDDSTLLIAMTGQWKRDGSLGRTGANAWTMLPGKGPYGAILEKSVARNANLVSHELGHYLNLSHVDDEFSLMNAIIYRRSTRVFEPECQTARAAAKYFWAAMIRS